MRKVRAVTRRPRLMTGNIVTLTATHHPSLSQRGTLILCLMAEVLESRCWSVNSSSVSHVTCDFVLKLSTPWFSHL